MAGQAPQLIPLSVETKLARLVQTGAWFGDSLDDGRIKELLEWIQSMPGYQLHYGSTHDAVAAIKGLLPQ
jgi:hypothetical protein